MAIWQFDLFFIPTRAPAPTLGDDGWVLPLLPARSVDHAHELLSLRLGQPWTMCEDIVVFGTEDRSRIDLGIEACGEAELTARVDARAESLGFCRLLCELAADLGCGFFSPEFRSPFDASTPALIAALMRSRAWAYALDPIASIRRLHDGGLG
jgi:hypothetical protein